MKPVHIRLSARLDLAEAEDWYEGQLAGLGSEFLDEFATTSKLIRENPAAFPIAVQDARKVTLNRFPYLVIYVEEPNRIEIIAVTHAHRDPDIWKRRVRKR